MQNEEATQDIPTDGFCILHSAFCLPFALDPPPAT